MKKIIKTIIFSASLLVPLFSCANDYRQALSNVRSADSSNYYVCNDLHNGDYSIKKAGSSESVYFSSDGFDFGGEESKLPKLKLTTLQFSYDILHERFSFHKCQDLPTVNGAIPYYISNPADPMSRLTITGYEDNNA